MALTWHTSCEKEYFGHGSYFELPTFSGGTQGPGLEKYINAINRVVRLEKLSDNEAAHLLRNQCTDTAFNHLESRIELDNADFSELVTALRRRFSNDTDFHEAIYIWTNLKQTNMSVRQFAGLVETTAVTLMDVLFGLKDPTSRDREIMTIFLNGLNLEIKKMIVTAEPKSFIEAILLAERAEKLIMSTWYRTEDQGCSAGYSNPQLVPILLLWILLAIQLITYIMQQIWNLAFPVHNYY